MKLIERLNVLIQAVTMAQKGGVLTLDDAVKAKSAIDIISAGVLNQNFTKSINVLIEIAILSQKKGVYSFKDAHMIYLAMDGIDVEFQNELNKINSTNPVNNNVLEYDAVENNENKVITIPPKKLKNKRDN